jgi:hypothetical protein
VKKSELERCLNNAYIMRSGYVHQLAPILSQLRIPHIAKNDVFVWENQPYLTYAGLLRVVYHVIHSFIEDQPAVATEDFDWHQALPGVVQLQMAPRHWVLNPTSFTPDQARWRLSGSLSMLQGAFADGEPIGLNPLPLLQKIGTLLGQANHADRSAMLALYSILMHFVKAQDRPSGYDQVTKKYAAAYQRCCVEMMLVWMITQDSTWPWTAVECAAVLETYRRSKFKKNAIAVPTLFEMSLYAEVANRFLESGNQAGYEKWCEAALFEAPGIPVLQDYIKSTEVSKGKLDPQQIITLRKDVTASEDAAAQTPPLEGQPATMAEPVTVVTPVMDVAPEAKEAQSVPVEGDANSAPATVETDVQAQADAAAASGTGSPPAAAQDGTSVQKPSPSLETGPKVQ